MTSESSLNWPVSIPEMILQLFLLSRINCENRLVLKPLIGSWPVIGLLNYANAYFLCNSLLHEGFL